MSEPSSVNVLSPPWTIHQINNVVIYPHCNRSDTPKFLDCGPSVFAMLQMMGKGLYSVTVRRDPSLHDREIVLRNYICDGSYVELDRFVLPDAEYPNL